MYIHQNDYCLRAPNAQKSLLGYKAMPVTSQPGNDEWICLSGAVLGRAVQPLAEADLVVSECEVLSNRKHIFLKSLGLRCRLAGALESQAVPWGSWVSSPQPAQASQLGSFPDSWLQGLGHLGQQWVWWSCTRGLCHCCEANCVLPVTRGVGGGWELFPYL